MNIKCNTNDFKTKCGVYIIRNLVNGKCYIGSTVMTFEKRYSHHSSRLNLNKHKNKHLQNAWNKYGENNFEFDILEICEKENCIIREQYYLDTILEADKYVNNISSVFKDIGYNMNPYATYVPPSDKETIEKRTKTFKEYVSKASEYYQMLKKYEIDFDEIPEKYLSIIQGWYNNIPWNKGKTYDSTDHLKVPKKITNKVLESRKKLSEKKREEAKSVIVYDINHNKVGTWRSIIDLCEFSQSSENNLPVIIKGKIKNKILLPQNVAKASKANKPYKGLYFELCDN